MSTVTIVGAVFVLALVVCAVFFLRCFAFASSSGRHALGVMPDDRACPVEIVETGAVILAPIDPKFVNDYGVGLSVDDDYPQDAIGARPYLDEYWRTSGRHMIDQTIEFAVIERLTEDDEYESVSGQLELVA
ncbi:hypothetical protein [Amycolatopsis sp. NPDC004625]|uniref:hypothetical protein n=1 Tax=Amycolatopsis sp. NPDC004625 TaxID=3154670 RepID=UPI0033A319AE